jgi:hypothetical protein
MQFVIITATIEAEVNNGEKIERKKKENSSINFFLSPLRSALQALNADELCGESEICVSSSLSLSLYVFFSNQLTFVIHHHL